MGYPNVILTGLSHRGIQKQRKLHIGDFLELICQKLVTKNIIFSLTKIEKRNHICKNMLSFQETVWRQHDNDNNGANVFIKSPMKITYKKFYVNTIAAVIYYLRQKSLDKPFVLQGTIAKILVSRTVFIYKLMLTRVIK